MKGLNEIRTRMRGVRDTIKITKAMYAISAASMPRSSAKLAASLSYLEKAEQGVRRLGVEPYNVGPFWQASEDPAKTAWVIIAADKGLCGDYNDRVFNLADQHLEDLKKGKAYSVGYTVREHLVNMGIRDLSAFSYMMQNPQPLDALQIADNLSGKVKEGKIERVFLVYTRAGKLYDQEVVVEKLLPLDFEANEVKVYLPNQEDAAQLVHHYLAAKLYAVLCDAHCALNYKRMIAMQTATNNGNAMLMGLTLQYNQARQMGITNELNDANGAKTAIEE